LHANASNVKAHVHACNDVKDTEKLSSRIDKSFGNPNKMKEVGKK